MTKPKKPIYEMTSDELVKRVFTKKGATILKKAVVKIEAKSRSPHK